MLITTTFTSKVHTPLVCLRGFLISSLEKHTAGFIDIIKFPVDNVSWKWKIEGSRYSRYYETARRTYASHFHLFRYFPAVLNTNRTTLYVVC